MQLKLNIKQKYIERSRFYSTRDNLKEKRLACDKVFIPST
jgi:hypothetical protein